MTDVHQKLMGKISDLKLYYEMAQEALQENDVDQALKIAKNGLEQAKLQDQGEWIEKFDSINAQLNQESLTPSIAKENLTTIKGIGSKVAERLNAVGMRTIEDLARSSVNRLALIDGIGKSTAQKFVNAARERLHTKSLNSFSESVRDRENSENMIDTSDALNTEGIANEFEQVEKAKGSLEHEVINPVRTRTKRTIKPWPLRAGKAHDTKYSRTRDTSLNEIMSNAELEEEGELENSEVADDVDFMEEGLEPTVEQVQVRSHPIAPKGMKLEEDVIHEKETMSQLEFQRLLETVRSELKSNDIFMIERVPTLRSIFIGIDLLGVKLIHVNESLDLICVFPIKVSTLKGSLIISAHDIEYKTSRDVPEFQTPLERLTRSYGVALTRVHERILDDLSNEGPLHAFFIKFLKIDIKLEKTITGKNLFYRSGPLQYKFLVEPLLICKNTVGFSEKVIPFAYQKIINTHFLNIDNISDLLQYLDQKFFLIETYAEQENAISSYRESTNLLMEELKKYSSPFILYGFVLFSILLLQNYSLLNLFVNLGYGVLMLYSLIVGYLYVRFYKSKLEIQQEFATPYFMRKVKLDETSLILINEELSPRLMEQFAHECLEKDSEYEIISKVEQANAQVYLTKKTVEKKVMKEELFEKEKQVKRDKENQTNSKLTDKFIKKYGSFLEE